MSDSEYRPLARLDAEVERAQQDERLLLAELAEVRRKTKQQLDASPASPREMTSAAGTTAESSLLHDKAGLMATQQQLHEAPISGVVEWARCNSLGNLVTAALQREEIDGATLLSYAQDVDQVTGRSLLARDLNLKIGTAGRLWCAIADTLQSTLHQGKTVGSRRRPVWYDPPKRSCAAESVNVPSVLDVDLRFNVRKVAHVNTVNGTAYVKIFAVFYWTDERLKGWANPQLPRKLWGPCIMLENAEHDNVRLPQNFYLVNPKTGLLKRTIIYSGTVPVPMELQTFPFDKQRVPIKFYCASSWMLLDGSQHGDLAIGQSFRLRWTPHDKEKTQGKPVRLMWTGQIREWTMQGVETMINHHEGRDTQTQPTFININFLITRKVPFYFYKALLPLWLLTGLSFSTFFFPIKDLSDRTSTVATYFLAAFAMLYVVGEALPKTDYFTKIDRIIITTTGGLVIVGGTSNLLSCLHYWTEISQLELHVLNLVCACILASMHIAINCVLLLPEWRQHKAEMKMLTMKLKEEHKHLGRPLSIEDLQEGRVAISTSEDKASMHYYPAVNLIEKKFIPFDRKAQLKRLEKRFQEYSES
jgi:hypothetical protein